MLIIESPDFQNFASSSVTVASPLLSAQTDEGASLRRCQHCGKDISGKKAPAKWCSKQCYQADNKEKYRARSYAWNAANPEKRRAYYAAYRAANREKIRASQAASNPEKRRAKHRQRRARKLNADTTTPTERKAMMEWDKRVCSKPKFTCYHCRETFRTKVNGEKQFHIDHIIALSKGGKHASENLCVACPTCNLKKSTKTLADWNNTLPAPTLGL